MLRRGLYYAFLDPHTYLAGLIVSQVICNIRFTNSMQALTIAQAAAASPEGKIAILTLQL
jgi:hypothetical protein